MPNDPTSRRFDTTDYAQLNARRRAKDIAADLGNHTLTGEEYDAVWAALRLLGAMMDAGTVPYDIDQIRTCGDAHAGLSAEDCQQLADRFADFHTLTLS